MPSLSWIHLGVGQHNQRFPVHLCEQFPAVESVQEELAVSFVREELILVQELAVSFVREELILVQEGLAASFVLGVLVSAQAG